MESKTIIQIISGMVIILAIFSGVTIKWQFEKEYTTLYRDGKIIARSSWFVEAERTYFNLNSWYDINVKCPKIVALGGHTTDTRCYYPANYYEQLSRSLINTKIELTNDTNYEVSKTTPFYKYGSRGSYTGNIIESMSFDEYTENELEFPKSYIINWIPKDTRNYKLVWRVENLKNVTLSDGNYTMCKYNFGHVTIDLKDNCNDLDYAEIKEGNKIYFHFNNIRGEQSLDLMFVDPSNENCSYSGVGDWLINCSDNCNLNDTNLLGNKVTIDGIGYLYGLNKISNSPDITIQGGGCDVYFNIKSNFTYRADNDIYYTNHGGDGTDDGANKWIDIDVLEDIDDYNYTVLTYIQPTSCNGSAGNTFTVKVNNDDSKKVSLNLCDLQGLDTGSALVTGEYEWFEYDIDDSVFIEGENKINFYEVSSACSYHCENWRMGYTNEAFNRTAWSSNDVPTCQTERGTNPLRENATSDCYTTEAMMYIVARKE